MPPAPSAPSSSAVSEPEAPPASPVERFVRGALPLAAWPLAVVGPALIVSVAVGIVEGRLPDAAPEGVCLGLGWECTTSLRDAAGLYAHPVSGPVVVLAAGVGAAVAHGMPARRRFRAVVVMLAGQALLAVLVGVTVIRMANDLA